MKGLCVEVGGDCITEGSSVFVQPEGDHLPFIAKLVKLIPDEDSGDGFFARVRWYYRPEDPGIPGGRKAFHGERELYMSDHQDEIHSKTIMGRCVVHTIDAYRDLESVQLHDYFSRFQFSVKTKRFHPEQVTVFCSCMQPENPDRPMSQCDACGEWFHPECCHTTLAEVTAAPTWNCLACAAAKRNEAAAAAAAPHPPLPTPPQLPAVGSAGNLLAWPTVAAPAAAASLGGGGGGGGGGLGAGSSMLPVGAAGSYLQQSFLAMPALQQQQQPPPPQQPPLPLSDVSRQSSGSLGGLQQAQQQLWQQQLSTSDPALLEALHQHLQQQQQPVPSAPAPWPMLGTTGRQFGGW